MALTFDPVSENQPKQPNMCAAPLDLILLAVRHSEVLVHLTHTMRGTGEREPHPCAAPSCPVLSAVFAWSSLSTQLDTKAGSAEGSGERLLEQAANQGFLQLRQGCNMREPQDLMGLRFRPQTREPEEGLNKPAPGSAGSGSGSTEHTTYGADLGCSQADVFASSHVHV